jgi:hypothetical protein
MKHSRLLFTPLMAMIAMIAVVLLPLGLLLVNRHTGFTSDWYNNMWMGGYMSHFFKAHGSFPYVLNAKEFVGIAFPYFYGHMLYPLMGFSGVLFGPNWGLRALCIMVFFLQFVSVYRAVLVLSQHKVTAWVTSILALWSIYPLSNLYARSAISEFIAVALLFSTLSYWVLFLKSTSQRQRWTGAFFFAFFLSLMFGIHPITAYYGCISVAFLILATIYVMRPSKNELKSYVGAMALASAMLLMTSAPWIDAFLTFGKYLPISQSLGRNSFLDGVDVLWVRLFLSPLDLRSLTGGTNTPTTYLDAQVNLPLFGLLVWSLWHRCSHLTVRQWACNRALQFVSLFVAIAVFILLISVTPEMEQHFVPIFKNFQIAYRMGNYFNIFILMGLFLSFTIQPLSKAPSENQRVVMAATFAAILAISFTGVLTKLVHGSVVWAEAVKYDYDTMRDGKPNHFVTVPKSFYSLANYAVFPGLKELAPNELSANPPLNFAVRTSADFGDVEPVNRSTNAGWTRTNVYSFAWNEIRENGVPLPPGRLAILSSDAVPVLAILGQGAGTAEYSVVSTPSTRWLVLRGVSGIVFWISFVLAIFLTLQKLYEFNAIFRDKK